MNNLEFESQQRRNLIRIVQTLRDLFEQLNEVKDDELQRTLKINKEDPLRFLDLNRQTKIKHHSNQSPPINNNRRITKRNNIIIGNIYQCKICQQQYQKQQSFARHFQQFHLIKQQQQDFNQIESLELSQKQ